MAVLNPKSGPEPSEEDPLKVLYIGGTGRTGSTLLEKVLGQMDGTFAAGEMTWLWYSLNGGGRCSCGEVLEECAVWRQVFDRAFGGIDQVDPAELFELRKRFDSRYLPLMVNKAGNDRLVGRLGPLPELLERLYLAIAETTNSRLIIDSSKEPHYSFILRSRPRLDLYFLHLVRDPRAIAFSWARHRPEAGFNGRVDLERRGPALSAVYHDVSNVASEIMWRGRTDRYLRLRYEDFVADPAGAIRAIGDFVQEPFDTTGVLDGNVAHLRPIHSAWGNPNRFDGGDVTIRPDSAWVDKMRPSDRIISTILTSPVAVRYGYPLRPR